MMVEMPKVEVEEREEVLEEEVEGGRWRRS